MAALRYRDEHNKVGYLLKPIGSDDYHQIIDFLRASHIRSPELGPSAIQATIDKTPYTITEDLVRSRLQLADDGGINDLPIAKIYSGMDNLGTKSGSWDQFGSPLIVALICLSDGRRFNWSSYIFKGMISNIGNAKKFLMYPRFLQAILGIETRIKRQYKVLMFSSKLFANMRLNFDGHPMPLLPVMLLQAQEGKGAGVAAQAVPQHMPTPDQPQDHLSTPPTQQTSDPNAPVFEHGQKDAPLGCSFHMSPPRSTQAPSTGHPSGGVEDPITLTALSSVVSTLVQKVNSLETELKDHKKLFKDVVGMLVKKVKAIEVKLKTKKRKMVVTVTVDSNIPPGGASNNPGDSTSVPAAVPTGASTVPTGSPSVPADVPPSVAPADKKQSCKEGDNKKFLIQPCITKDDWIHIMARVEANASLSKTLLGDDVSEDNFPARMAALIKRKKQALAEKLAKERRNKPMTQAQQRTYMRQFIKNQSSAIYSTGTLKRTGLVLEEPSSKRHKSTEASIPYVPDDLDADAQTFIKVVSIEDSDDEAPPAWSGLILHMVDRQDLVKLYGLVVKYYENHHVAGTGLISWGDLQVLFDSHDGDVSYPLSVKLMKRMLKHKLKIDTDVVGNDMTTAEQLIQLIKNQLATAYVSSV
uniref:Synaptobrevin, longin-like domain protein n=1 Tax=Tanacetum cinerariifolium TaxID=118510 RepID=A0A6L2P2S9_TANCI|nr:hypothetical protein [Tanacetum cinerariifolium]